MADIYLWSVPSDANSSDVRLRDPLVGGIGAQTLVQARHVNASSFGTQQINLRVRQVTYNDTDVTGAHKINLRIIATRYSDPDVAGAHRVNLRVIHTRHTDADVVGGADFLNLRLLQSRHTNTNTFGAQVVTGGAASSPSNTHPLARRSPRSLARRLAA